MNGLRSNSPRHSDTSSLEALNRTIEGLEARIEGLMNQSAREQLPDPAQPARPAPRAASARDAAAAPQTRFDPIDEIRQRQRALDAGWERPADAATQPQRPAPRAPAPQVSDTERYERDYRASTAVTPPPSRTTRPTHAQERAAAAASRYEQRPAAPQNDSAMRDIAQALVSLRQELKQDLSDGVAREVHGLRDEIRNIKTFAEDQQFAGDIRDDIARLAASIEQLGSRTSPDEAYELRTEFEDLRTLMEQVAREDSVQRLEGRWSHVEDSLRGFDAASLQDEIVSLAYRLDDIKGQLGAMSDSPAVQVLEDKLIAIATAMEQMGKRMQPNDEVLTEQFSGLDLRLDEISRAIAVASTRTASPIDNNFAQRVETRLTSLASQMDDLNQFASARIDPTDELTARIDALTGRIEDLAAERNAAHLDERLDQLSSLLERGQKPSVEPELTSFLTDISRKIDALDQGAVNDGLAQRLDLLSRRIEDLDYRHSQPQPAPVFDDSAFLRIEERLGNIALRLEETTTAVPSDNSALRNLEDQIANLSSLISQPSYHDSVAMPPELDARMAAIEDYMASSDEYIIEAARQAAEAVIDAYERKGLGGNVASPDMAMLNELASDLRNLETLSRGTEERTHRTFEALHETLVQIAGRLDSMDNRQVVSAPVFQEPVYQEKAQHRHPEMPAPVAAKAPASLFAFAGDVPAREETHDNFRHAPMPAATFPDEGLIAREPVATQDDDEDFRDGNDVVSDEIVPPSAAKPAKAEKKSLLAGLTRRFKSGTAKAPAKDKAKQEPEVRAQVHPAPSLDPTDVLTSEQENDLLEPGTGAPDIKKILERVRASQAATRSATNEGDNRADYIAAARRAAQAAAQETQPTKGSAASRKAKPAVSEAGKGSAFSRYRRPLLLGIGAILLAMMAMPLVKTLVSGDSVPEQTIEQSAPEQGAITPTPETPAVTEQAASQPVTIPSDLMIEEDPAASDGMDSASSMQENRIDPRPIGGANLPPEPAANAPAPDAGAQVAETPTPTAPAIAVPSAIQPASLAEAASRGDRLALFEVGARYTEGRGVTADLGEAAKWYKLAADEGLAPAQYRLANMYEKGTGVARDLTQAKLYYNMAANQGNAGAMHNLAVLLASDASGAPDYTAAANWFVKAADLGMRDSQFNLAILYARGSGVKQDIEESYKWFSIAARDGDADAGQKRDEVANAMRPEQLESARAKVDAWKATPPKDDANSVTLPDEWTAQGGVKTSSVDMEKAIRNIQAILNNNGYDAGVPDGKLGKNTVTAIKNFQTSIGHTADGRITDELVTALLARNK